MIANESLGYSTHESEYGYSRPMQLHLPETNDKKHRPIGTDTFFFSSDESSDSEVYETGRVELQENLLNP